MAPVEPQEQLFFRRSSYDPLGSRASLRGLGLYPSERDLTERNKLLLLLLVMTVILVVCMYRQLILIPGRLEGPTSWIPN